MTGGKAVQPDNGLVQREQGFQQVAADKAGDAGNEPGFGGLGQIGQELVVAGHWFNHSGSIVRGFALTTTRAKPFPHGFSRSNQRRRSEASLGRMYFRSYSTCWALPSARMACAPMSLNWW